VTSEKGWVRVKVYGPGGELESVVAGPDRFDEETLQPDLALDSKGRVLVLDPKRRRVRVFEERKRAERK
jgi:hypothetical protein